MAAAAPPVAPQQPSYVPSSLPSFHRALMTAQQQHRALEFSRFAQLASVDASGLPHVRTVAMRDFTGALTSILGQERASLASGLLFFSTDLRTQKVSEFPVSKHIVELCWYFALSQDQFRLRCQVLTVDNELQEAEQPSGDSGILLKALVELRQQAWEKHMDDAFRREFESAWPGSPNASFENLKKLQLSAPGPESKRWNGDLDTYEPQPLDSHTPSRNFALCVLLPLRGSSLRSPSLFLRLLHLLIRRAHTWDRMRSCPSASAGQGQFKTATPRVRGPAESTSGGSRDCFWTLGRSTPHRLLWVSGQQRRWLHAVDPEDGSWNVVELNN